jgi:hypothetical protein
MFKTLASICQNRGFPFLYASRPAPVFLCFALVTDVTDVTLAPRLSRVSRVSQHNLSFLIFVPL